jgi:uncharacterized membrane protein YphA (DoxX/SURF4 family)
VSSKAKRLLWDKLLLGGVLARLLLGGIFVYASIDKILDPDGFAQMVANYKLVPAWGINIMAITMPWLEAMAGILLILGRWTKENAAILAGLLLVFIVAISINLARGLDFDCGCFSTTASGKHSSIWLLVRDIALLAPAVQLLWFVRREPEREAFVVPKS